MAHSVCHYNVAWTIEVYPLAFSAFISVPEVVCIQNKQTFRYSPRYHLIDLSLPDANCHPCQQLHWQIQSSWMHRLNPSPWAESVLPITNLYVWIHEKLLSPELSVCELSWTLKYIQLKRKKNEREGEEGSLKRSVNKLVSLFIETEDICLICHFFIVIMQPNKFSQLRKHTGYLDHDFGQKSYFCK